MKLAYDYAFEYLMKNEGGFSDDPDDLGGKTIFGIASKYHSKWYSDTYYIYKNQGREAALILASKFYKENFWNDRYAFIQDTSLAFRLFDFGVNASVKVAVKIFQEAVNKAADKNILKIDGVFGKTTLVESNQIEQENIYVMYCILIYFYYLKRPTAWKHLRGWRNRLLKRYYLTQ